VHNLYEKEMNKKVSKAQSKPGQSCNSIRAVIRSKWLLSAMLIIVLVVPMLLTGCQSKEDRKEMINQLAEVQAKRKEQSKGLSETLVDNMKKNAAEEYEEIFNLKEKEEAEMNKSLNNGLSFDEESDRLTDNVGGIGYRFFFRIVFAMSDNALPGSFVSILVGLAFAWFTRHNKVAYKFYLALAVIGPLLFILSVYLPPAMIQFYK